MRREPVVNMAIVGAAVGGTFDYFWPDMPAGTVSAISAIVFCMTRRYVFPVEKVPYGQKD